MIPEDELSRALQIYKLILEYDENDRLKDNGFFLPLLLRSMIEDAISRIED